MSGVSAPLCVEVSAERLRAHVTYLASDKLEGRRTGTPGARLAAEYIVREFARKDADEDDVVDSEHDLEDRQRDQCYGCFGGEEFFCVLPDTSAREARAKLGEIQMAAARSGIRFSTGVAELAKHDDVVALLARADRDLYDFKANRGEIVQLPTQSTREVSAS